MYTNWLKYNLQQGQFHIQNRIGNTSFSIPEAVNKIQRRINDTPKNDVSYHYNDVNTHILL